MRRMRRPARWLILVLVLLAAMSREDTAQGDATLALTGVSVVDPVTGTVDPEMTVVVAGNTIAAVGRRLAPPGGARVVNAAGTFLIPGLWDMHAHHELTGADSLPLFVANGVTGTRDMGSALDVILGLRGRIAAGTLVGPALVVAGPILDDAPSHWPFRMRIRSANEGRDAVRMLKKRGVDFVKVHDHTPREAYFAIAQEARALGLPMDGHVPQGVTLQEAADAGQRTIEHLANFRVFTECSGGPVYQPERCRSVFDAMAKRRQWHTPTLAGMKVLPIVGTPADDPVARHTAFASPSLRAGWAANQRESRVTPEMVRRWGDLSRQALLAVRDMHRAGVPLLAGCDALVPGFCLHDELATLVENGLTPLQALQTATINPARALGQDARRGRIATGMAADLVWLDANPLADIAHVRRIKGSVVRGRLFTRGELDDMLAGVRRQFGQPDTPRRQLKSQ
jgi:imidazolonepropionase-like amidohydrolase